MPVYKMRLLEKMVCGDEEGVFRADTSNTTKMKIMAEQGIKYHGNPKSLDYMYDLVSKMKKNDLPLDTPKRKLALEEIAIYVEHKPAHYFKHFGFVEVVVISLKSTDNETRIICLAIISKLSQDEVLCKEIYEMGAFESIKQLLVAQEEVLRLLTLSVYESLCGFETIKEGLMKKVMLDNSRIFYSW